MRAYRSPLRLFVFGMIGVALILAAVDVMFGHWLSTPPDSNNGVLSTRGQAQQRGDIVWGAGMVGIGTLLVGGSVVELVRRRPVVEVSQEGVTVAIGSHEADVSIPWDNVRSVTTDVEADPYDGSRRNQLVVDVYDRAGIPEDPIGAHWEGDALKIDANDWSKSVTEIALSAQGALGHHRRVAEITAMGPPSLTWDTTVDQPPIPPDPAPVSGEATSEPHVDDVGTAVDLDEVQVDRPEASDQAEADE